MIKNIKEIIAIAIAAAFILFCSIDAAGCTSAIIGAEANPSGRPILWKHRDTSAIDNKVEYIAPSEAGFGYVALFNAADKDLKEAWIGMNDAGFAVMNTASYNIKDDRIPAKKMDKEGILMSKALRTCRTVEDFARFLESYPRPMGVEANFGAIDAEGNGAFFETNNHSFKRYDLKDEPDHVLIRSNYSHSGRKGEGYGFVREANACSLLAPYIDERTVTPEVLTEEVSRSFYHDLKKRDYRYAGDRWVVDQDFIPRYKSTATVAIEGCVPVQPGEKITPSRVAEEYVMWTGLGYPPVSEIRAVRCSPDGVDRELRGVLPGGHSPLSDEAKRLRDEVFPLKKGNGDKYIDMLKLYNPEGTGYAQRAIEKNHETYRIENARRAGRCVGNAR